MKRSVAAFRLPSEWFAFFLLLSALGGACSGPLAETEPQRAYHQVKEEGGLLLDVRSPEEYLQNRIQDARNVPITELEQRLGEIEDLVKGDKDRPIVVYCERGSRASKAREMLLNAGFKSVTNLGGIHDWPDAEEIAGRID